ncbi:MAG: MFS transporter [Chloroflexia bacterium]|nr:MFS transporter [Chloroflexia bacterium]
MSTPATLGRVERSLPQGLRAFEYRDYRIFWFSQLFSLTGTWVQSLAQSWLVLTLTGSPAALGLIGVCQFGPTLLLGLPAGVLVDRLPKRRLLMATQIAAASITVLLALLVATGQVQLWQIYVAAAALGVVSAIDMPTRQSFVVDLVGKDGLMNAIALNSALFNTTRVVGPALAGVLLAVYGPEVCFVLNAFSYIPVIAALGVMRTHGNPARGGELTSAIARLREGLAYVRATPVVRLPIMLAGLMAVFGMNFGVWAPLLAREALAIGASGFGLLMSSLGVGSLTGALTLAFTGRRPSPRVMLGTALLFGTLEIALGVAAGLRLPAVLAMILMAGIGFAMSTTMAQANTTVQTNSPDRLRGRVMSIYLTVFAGSTPLGAALAGFMAGAWGAPVAVAAGGAIVAVVSLVIGYQLSTARA